VTGSGADDHVGEPILADFPSLYFSHPFRSFSSTRLFPFARPMLKFVVVRRFGAVAIRDFASSHRLDPSACATALPCFFVLNSGPDEPDRFWSFGDFPAPSHALFSPASRGVLKL